MCRKEEKDGELFCTTFEAYYIRDGTELDTKQGDPRDVEMRREEETNKNEMQKIKV